VKIGLIDVDSHNFPNIPLMKLSAWHKNQGHSVEWYNPDLSCGLDRVYMSKVFTFSPNYGEIKGVGEVHYGGTGYKPSEDICFKGKSMYFMELPRVVEAIYPDYSIYPQYTTDTAYGFLTRGCPNNCPFCIVSKKEGCVSSKVAAIKDFRQMQKTIRLLDPNILACDEWLDLLNQLAYTGAYIDFTQGLDVRKMTVAKASLIKMLKVQKIYFAWDNFNEKSLVLEKLRMFKEISMWGSRKCRVYVLTNFNTCFDEDLERVYTLRDIGCDPYVMIYNKESLPKGHRLRHLQRYVNNKQIFWNPQVKNFKVYDPTRA